MKVDRISPFVQERVLFVDQYMLRIVRKHRDTFYFAAGLLLALVVLQLCDALMILQGVIGFSLASVALCLLGCLLYDMVTATAETLEEV